MVVLRRRAVEVDAAAMAGTSFTLAEKMNSRWIRSCRDGGSSSLLLRLIHGAMVRFSASWLLEQLQKRCWLRWFPAWCCCGKDGGRSWELAVVARTVARCHGCRAVEKTEARGAAGREKKMALLFVVAGEEMAAAAAMVGGRRGEN